MISRRGFLGVCGGVVATTAFPVLDTPVLEPTIHCIEATGPSMFELLKDFHFTGASVVYHPHNPLCEVFGSHIAATMSRESFSSKIFHVEESIAPCPSTSTFATPAKK